MVLPIRYPVPEKEELDILLDSQLPTFQRMADSFQIIT